MTADKAGAGLAAEALYAGGLEERWLVDVGHLVKTERCIDLLVAHD